MNATFLLTANLDAACVCSGTHFNLCTLLNGDKLCGAVATLSMARTAACRAVDAVGIIPILHTRSRALPILFDREITNHKNGQFFFLLPNSRHTVSFFCWNKRVSFGHPMRLIYSNTPSSVSSRSSRAECVMNVKSHFRLGSHSLALAQFLLTLFYYRIQTRWIFMFHVLLAKFTGAHFFLFLSYFWFLWTISSFYSGATVKILG